MFNWFWHERPLAEASGSATFLSHLGDFVSLVPQTRNGRWFEDFIVEHLLRDGPASFFKVEGTKWKRDRPSKADYHTETTSNTK